MISDFGCSISDLFYWGVVMFGLLISAGTLLPRSD
jgi:hypothetical protein